MNGVRALLGVLFLAVAVYTLLVVGQHGWSFIAVALTDMAALDWTGQFVLDFFSYLLLSALWIAWRHGFSPAGIGLASVAAVGGILFLSIYLLVLSFQTGGDVKAMLLGKHASD